MSLTYSEKYKKEDACIKYSGLLMTDTGLENYFSDRVNKRYYDVEGIERLSELFLDVASTGFDIGNLLGSYTSAGEKITWKIGESFVQCYLEDHCNAKFPYNGSRDSKVERASLPGPDLVGFFYAQNETVFLFGEVKTSAENSFPPGVVRNSEDGLTVQLQRLKSDEKRRQILIKWLGFKVGENSGSQFSQDFIKAVTIYYNQSRERIKMKIVGALVRDVDPNELDLKSSYDSLSSPQINGITIELLGLYLPLKIERFQSIIGDNPYAN